MSRTLMFKKFKDFLNFIKSEDLCKRNNSRERI